MAKPTDIVHERPEFSGDPERTKARDANTLTPQEEARRAKLPRGGDSKALEEQTRRYLDIAKRTK